MYKLSFCSIYIHKNKILEVVINGGVDVSEEMIEKLFIFIKAKVGVGVSVLLNRAIKYKYKMEALVKFSRSDLISNLAVVVYDKESMIGSKLRREKFNESGKNVQIFSNKEGAFLWLESIIA